MRKEERGAEQSRLGKDNFPGWGRMKRTHQAEKGEDTRRIKEATRDKQQETSPRRVFSPEVIAVRKRGIFQHAYPDLSATTTEPV